MRSDASPVQDFRHHIVPIDQLHAHYFREIGFVSAGLTFVVDPSSARIGKLPRSTNSKRQCYIFHQGIAREDKVKWRKR